MKKYRIPLACFFIFLWGMFLRWQGLANRELWNDEIYQIQKTLGPFKPIWCREIYGDFTCFPGDYLLTYPFVQMSGYDHKWISAIPHIFVTILGFYLLYRLCKKYFTTVFGYVITFFIYAFNANLVYHAFELRPYAVLPVMTISAFLLIGILFERHEKLSRLQKFLTGLALVGLMLFHMYGVLIVGLLALWFLLAGVHDSLGRRRLVGPLKLLILSGLLALPVWLWYSSCDPYHLSRENLLASGRYVFDFIPNPMENLIGFLKGVFGNLMGDKKLYVFLLSLIVAPFIPYPQRFRQLGFFLILIVLPIEFLLLADVLKAYWFIPRQFVWVMPLLAFLLGWQWDALIKYYWDTRTQDDLTRDT